MFLVISAICVGNKPLDYHPIRSVFTAQERFSQTIETIHSIREYTDEKIFFVEVGNHKKINFSLDKIKKSVDYFLDLGDDDSINEVVNSPHKSWAELLITKKTLEVMPESEDYILKLSGRYCLTSDFKLENLKKGVMSAKIFDCGGPTRCCSVLYSILGTKNYSDLCKHCYTTYNQRKWTSIEEMIYSWFVKKNSIKLDNIGCKGKVAVHGNEEIY